MSIINTIAGLFWAVLCCPEIYCNGAVCIQIDREAALEELPIIIAAAERNNCRGDDFLILLAIRKAENGAPGREFGILHPKALAEIQVRPKDSLDIQAGWAAATIVKNRLRWRNCIGADCDFINFLGNRYCPSSADAQGNRNWKRNVQYWFEKFKNPGFAGN